MGHGYLAGFTRMFELLVRTFSVMLHPAFGQQPLDYIPAMHGNLYTLYTSGQGKQASIHAGQPYCLECRTTAVQGTNTCQMFTTQAGEIPDYRIGICTILVLRLPIDQGRSDSDFNDKTQ